MLLWISTGLWLLLLLSTGNSFFRIISGKGKDHDALAFSYALVALVFIGFSGRWFVAPNSVLFLEIMRLFGCVLAVFLVFVVRFYKRAS